MYSCMSVLEYNCMLIGIVTIISFLCTAFFEGVDGVRLANAELQPDAGSAVLKLMDCVISVAEMVNGNPSGVTCSKDETHQKTICPLDAQKMSGMIGEPSEPS